MSHNCVAIPLNRWSHFGRKPLASVKSPQCVQMDNVNKNTAKQSKTSTTFIFNRIIMKYNGVCWKCAEENPNYEIILIRSIQSSIQLCLPFDDDDSDDIDTVGYLECQSIGTMMLRWILLWPLSQQLCSKFALSYAFDDRSHGFWWRQNGCVCVWVGSSEKISRVPRFFVALSLFLSL